MRRLALAILVVLFTPGAATAQHPVLALLDEYAAGRYRDVREALVQLEDVAEAREALEKGGRAWVESGADGTIDQRRVIAATFALEFANARMLDEWQRLRSLVEWGCELLREGPPTAGEATWHLASVAVAQRAADWDLLRARGERSVRGFARTRFARDDHARHGTDRFPADQALAFSEAQSEAAYVTPPWPRGPRWEQVFRTHDRIVLIEKALEEMRPFLTDPATGAEANFWTGMMLALGLGRPDEGLRHLEAAVVSSDRFIAAIAHQASGRLAAADTRVGVAERHYRAALEQAPGSQSTSLSLATLLFVTGRPEQAYDIMTRAFDEDAPADPFKHYGFGNYRFIENYLETLRQRGER